MASASVPFPAHTPTTPPPSTITKPPFTPRTKKRGVARPTTPESEAGSDDDLSLAMLPKGHQLVVRGIVPKLNESPVTSIRKLLVELELDPRYKDFATFGLDVQPFSDRTSSISSACYIEVLSSKEAEPRVDLLELVMDAILEAKPELEIRWSASKKGRSDKRLLGQLRKP